MQKPILIFLSESNKIEGVYDSKSQAFALEAWEYLLSYDELTVENILWTHHILMKNHITTGDGLGEYRKVDVMIGGRLGLKPIFIEGAMNEWIKECNKIVHGFGKQKFSKEQLEMMIQNAHVSFEKIHGFIDGNGRLGRILMNWTLDKLGMKILVIYEKDKQAYYEWFK